MGKRKERRLAAMMAAGRRVKLDLFTEPSVVGDGGTVSLDHQVGEKTDQNQRAGVPTSPSSSGKKQENPLTLLGQYSDEELDGEANEQTKHSDEENSPGNPNDQVEHVEANSSLECTNNKDSTGLVGDLDQLDSAGNAEGNDAKMGEMLSATTQHCETDSAAQTCEEACGSKTTGDVTGDWKVVMDEQSNQYYYWNTVTGETSWEVPNSLALEAENSSEHVLSVATSGHKAQSLGHGHSTSQLGSPLVAYASQIGSVGLDSKVVEYGSVLNGGDAHLLYDVNQSLSSYNNTATSIPFGEASTLPDMHSFHQAHSLLPDHLTSLGGVDHVPSVANQDMHEIDYNKSLEADSLSTRIVEYGESLLQRLQSLQGTKHLLVIKEIEIRISDCKALSSYGSSLLPFWWHTEAQLKQLESAIDREASQLEVDKRTSSPAKSDSSPTIHASKETQQETMFVTTSVDGKESEVLEHSQTAVSLNLVRVDPHAEEVDMDVEMEVDEAIDGETAATNISTAEGPGPSELLQLSSSSVERPITANDSNVPPPPPPPDEEWIPPPPPENEPIPPPPPPEEPPVSSIPPPYPETLPPLTYQGEYNPGYAAPTYEYYAPMMNEIGNHSYYASVNGCHTDDQLAPPHFVPVVASALPQLVTDANSVAPAAYYDASAGNIPSNQAISGMESSTYFVEGGPISYSSNGSLYDQSGVASSLEPRISALPSKKLEISDSAVSGGACIGTAQTASVALVAQAAETSLVNRGNVDVPSSATNKNQPRVARNKKRTLAVAPSLRSNKKVSSLVDKWKAAKEEMQAEEDEEPENAFEVLERKRQKEIEEWRARQIASGEAQDNANFVPLGGDWRERVRRKKAESKAEAAQTPPETVDDAKSMPDLIELSKDLPSGWQAFWDETTNGVYYGNTITSETTWTRPSR